MEEAGNRRYVPDHAIPVPLSTIANSKTERIKFGKVDLVRVQVMGVVSDVKLNESDMDITLIDEEEKYRVMVQRIFTTSFPRELAEQLAPGQLLEVYGKIRVLEGGEPFLNALSIHIVTEPQFEAFGTQCQISEMFYKKNTPALPQGTHCRVPERMGLSKKLGSLDRFPVYFLEESNSTENNMGQWPKEIEQLAAGISLENNNRKRKMENVEEEESDSEDETDSEDEEVSDSVSEDDVKAKKMTPDNEMEADDSFEAGPVKLDPTEKRQENGTIQFEVVPDSFDAAYLQVTKKVEQNENSHEFELVESDSCNAEEVKTEELQECEDVPDSFEDGVENGTECQHNEIAVCQDRKEDFGDSFDVVVGITEMVSQAEHKQESQLAADTIDSFESVKTSAVNVYQSEGSPKDAKSEIEYDSFENV